MHSKTDNTTKVARLRNTETGRYQHPYKAF